LVYHKTKYSDKSSLHHVNSHFHNKETSSVLFIIPLQLCNGCINFTGHHLDKVEKFVTNLVSD